MNNVLKSWKTSLLGLLMIGMAIYRYFTTGESIDWMEIVTLLFGIGFLVSKDGDQTHSGKRT